MAAKKYTAAHRRKMLGRAKDTDVAKEPLMNEEQANPQNQVDKAFAEFKALSNDVERFRKVLDGTKERVRDLENQLALAKSELLEYEAMLECSNRRLSVRKQVLSQEIFRNENITCGSSSYI